MQQSWLRKLFVPFRLNQVILLTIVTDNKGTFGPLTWKSLWRGKHIHRLSPLVGRYRWGSVSRLTERHWHLQQRNQQWLSKIPAGGARSKYPWPCGAPSTGDLSTQTGVRGGRLYRWSTNAGRWVFCCIEYLLTAQNIVQNHTAYKTVYISCSDNE